MNWNNNDTKYIIKRFIIFILIAMAMFIISTWKVHALSVYYLEWDQAICPGGHVNNAGDWKSCTNTTDNYFRFKNTGTIPEGYYDVSFTIQSSIGQNIAAQMKDVSCQVNGTDVARIGADTYSTSGIFYTVKCENVPITNGINQLYIKSYSLSNLQTQVLVYNSVVPHGADTSSISGAINNQTQQQHQDSQAINDSINNDNVTTSDADDFSNNQAFSDSTGLESVIQLPLNMVNSLTNTCQPIQITIPFIDYTGEIPCMSTIYRSKFNALYTIVKIVINGFFVYRLLLKIYELIHNAKQPDEDKLEVIDL